LSVMQTQMVGVRSSLEGKTPLVLTLVGWSVISAAGMRLLGQVNAPFLPMATFDALGTVLAP
jgi:hypothetical protein